MATTATRPTSRRPVGTLAGLGAADADGAGVDDEGVAHVELGVEGVLLRAHPEPGAAGPGITVILPGGVPGAV